MPFVDMMKFSSCAFSTAALGLGVLSSFRHDLRSPVPGRCA